jgi:hypothetical protein
MKDQGSRGDDKEPRTSEEVRVTRGFGNLISILPPGKTSNSQLYVPAKPKTFSRYCEDFSYL